MSYDPGYVGPVTPGGSPGPQANIGGQRAATNPPPGGTAPGGFDLPASISSLSQVISSLDGAIYNMNAQMQQMNLNMAMMSGKGDQYSRMALGLGASPTVGNSAVPHVRATFMQPGGGFIERDNPTMLRGTRQEGALPAAPTSMLTLRQRAARAISQSGSGIFGPRLQSMADPVTGEVRTMLHTGFNPDGSAQYRSVEPHEVPKLQRQERIGSAIQGALGRAAAGEGLGGLRGIAGALIPEAAVAPVGIALAAGTVAYEGAQMVSAQRQKNQQFQEILGGSNFSQFGQRISQTAFGLSQMFGMGQGQAEEAFMGATRLGMRGGERRNALNMAVSSFNSMGMSVAQSLQAISVQAASGYENFDALEKSLKQVSATAKETSQNANQVRDSFIGIYSTMTQQLGGGPGVQGTATGIANMKAQLGRQFAGVDFSGLTDQTRMYMMASQSGLTYNQFLQNAITQPGYLTGAVNRNLGTFLNTLGAGQGSTAFQAVNRAAQANPEFARGANGQYSSAQIQGLTNDVLNQLPPTPQIKAVLQQALGIDTSQMSDQMAAEYYVGWALGQNRVHGQGAAGPQQINAAQRAALQKTGGPGAAADYVNRGGSAAQIAALGAAAKGSGIAGGTRIDVGTIRDQGARGRLRQQYLQQVAKTGTNSTIIDQMLKQGNSWKQLYTVKTAQGERTVDFQDLITNYSDQLASGGVKIAQGTNAQGESIAGLSVASQYGGPSDTQAFAASSKAASASQNLKGKDRFSQIKSATEKQNIQNRGKTNVVITLSPQAAQYFGVMVNGQSVTNSTATSLNPTLGNVTPESLAGSIPSNMDNTG